MHIDHISKKLYYFNIFLLIAVVFVSFSIYQKSVENKNKKVEEKRIVKSLDAFNSVSVKAKSAYVYDLKNGRVS